MANNCSYSDKLLARALTVIPAGAQTDTKSVTKRLVGRQPSFFVKGKGAYAQDPDGSWWLDCQMGLGSYILGYNDPNVNRRVHRQLRRGSIFSLSSALEVEVAGQLLGIFPEFQMVRFSKNGSDVTSAAIRIARLHTGRDHVIACGYHGFQDWSMALRPGIAGIPICVRSMTEGVEPLNLHLIPDLLDAYPNRFAAVIIDAGGSGIPDFNLLRTIRDKCHHCGTVFVLDEIVSGFRAGLRGVLGLSGIVPDMICLGKALANGFPLSALMGPESLLTLAPTTGMTATFAGDCIALSAAQATLEQLTADGFYNSIQKTGTRLMSTMKSEIEHHRLDALLRCVGYPGLSKLAPGRTDTHDGDAALRFIMGILAERKIFWQGSFVLCRDFGEVETTHLLTALAEGFQRLSAANERGQLGQLDEQLRESQQTYLARLREITW